MTPPGFLKNVTQGFPLVSYMTPPGRWRMHYIVGEIPNQGVTMEKQYLPRILCRTKVPTWSLRNVRMENMKFTVPEAGYVCLWKTKLALVFLQWNVDADWRKLTFGFRSPMFLSRICIQSGNTEKKVSPYRRSVFKTLRVGVFKGLSLSFRSELLMAEDLFLNGLRTYPNSILRALGLSFIETLCDCLWLGRAKM
ncbi:hypothetical protein ACFE04_008649 [Oxalis oulophora]